MADIEVCTISKRKEVTQGPMYVMFRKILAESCQPCPYFKTVQALKVALVDHALEQAKGSREIAQENLNIGRDNMRYLLNTLPKGERADSKKPTVSAKVEQMYQLMAVMEREKKAVSA